VVAALFDGTASAQLSGSKEPALRPPVPVNCDRSLVQAGSGSIVSRFQAQRDL
jgi:hypothetical protein